MVRTPRLTLLALTCCGLLATAAYLPSDPGSPVRSTRPAWVKTDGVVMAGNWEPLTFLRRRGGATVADLEDWPRERTDAAARKLHEAGVNLVITNFYKGFGLKAEAADIEATRRFVEFAHHYGIRVGGYIGASMMYETFFAEEPEARDWMQVDEQGRPVYYSPVQPYRYMACRNNPGYQAFIRKLLRIGVEDLHLDLIHFDQMESWNEPNVCRCRYCRQQFVDYLKSRYTSGQRMDRFSFDGLDLIQIPPFAPILAAQATQLVDPLMQDWVRFRAWSYARHYGEYDAYLEKLNPEVALEGNPNVDLSLNKAFRNSVDLEHLLKHGDIVWSEEPQQASWTADNRLVSKIRSYKLVRGMGKSLFAYTGGRFGTWSSEAPPHLSLAEAMAYNDLNLGMVGDVAPDGVRLTPEAKRYIDFFHAHRATLAGTTPIADVAVLRSFASIEFNPAEANVSTVLYEQSLIQAKIPFTIIVDGQLADLSRYKVLVLADQDALSDAQVESIRRFVEQGGGLVATDNSSLLTEARWRRRKFGLADLLGRDLPPANESRTEPTRRTFGKGRVVYIPRVVPSDPPPPAQLNYRFDKRHWKLARNHEELVAAVEWAAARPLSARVFAPLSVTMELAQQKNSGAILLHLVNFDYRHPVQNIDVDLNVAAASSRTFEITVESPDEGSKASTIRATERAGRLSFRIPRLSTYILAVIRAADLDAHQRDIQK